MVGQKKKNCYRKRRKGKAGVQRYDETDEQSIDKAAETTQTPRCEDDNEATCVSSSRKKMKIQDDVEQPGDAVLANEEDEYRLICLTNLSSLISDIHGCEEGILFYDLFV
jgi:hypothetical protein